MQQIVDPVTLLRHGYHDSQSLIGIVNLLGPKPLGRYLESSLRRFMLTAMAPADQNTMRNRELLDTGSRKCCASDERAMRRQLARHGSHHADSVGAGQP